MSEAADRSELLLARLRMSRARLERRRALEAATRVMLLAVCAYFVARLAGLAGTGGWWAAAGTASFPRLAGGVVLAIAGVAAILRLRRTRPTLLDLARRADRRFRLDDRLATAVEFGMGAPAAGPRGPVLDALFDDAGRRADHVDPRVLVPIGVPRAARWLAMALVTVVGVEMVAPAARPVGHSTASATNRADEVADILDLIRETAALLRTEAARREDEYMLVIATALETLALEVVEQRLSTEEVAARLARLAAHADLALNRGVAEAPGEFAALDPAAMEAAGALESGESAGTEPVEDPGPSGGRAQAGTRLSEARSALEEVRSRLSGEQGSGEQLASSGAPDPATTQEGQQANRGPEDRSSGEAGPGDRPLANISLDAMAPGEDGIGEGGSPQEGAGAASFMGTDSEARALPDGTFSRDFELPPDGGSRRRLPIEIVPATRLSDVEEVALERGGWRPGREERVSSDQVGVSYRDVAARYFLSLTREAAAEP